MTEGILKLGRSIWPIAGLAMLLLSGCASLEDNVQQGYVTGKKIGGSDAAFTTADVRTVVERTRNDSGMGKIICSEPSPDIAMAIAAISKLNASVGDGTGQDVTVEAQHSLTQSLTTLAGRSVAVQALRDGTYRACEAYANGTIGKTEYSLILSQYGDVLATLLFAENADKSGIGSVAGNYVAYSLPRLAHTIFVSCVQNGHDVNKNFYLDKFCDNIAQNNNLAILLESLKKSMPDPFSGTATAKKETSETTSWTIQFSTRDNLTLEGYAELSKALNALKKNSGKITIVGHVDTVKPKNAKTNVTIARNRAEKVRNILEVNGISGTRISTFTDINADPMKRVAVITVAAEKSASP